MTEHTGPERRKFSNDFEAAVISFMARVDQRNQDRDLSHAVQDDIVALHEDRLTAIEQEINTARGVMKVVGVPAMGSLAWVIFKLGHSAKELFK